MPLAFALVLHAHQPVDNFDEVIEQAYRASYLPFVEAAAERAWLKLNLHFSGYLLDWLGERHPEYIRRLRELIGAGRLEMLGGGYYEPILPAIPCSDQQEQLGKLAAALERHFRVRPRGAWIAERVWEPDLPAALAQAGVDYVLLDDGHLELAGLRSEDLHGYWLTETQGATLGVVPSNHFLRQALPFRPEAEGLAFLAAAAARQPDSLLTMGDDLEKFGNWPHTAKHVYADGWLKRFLDGLEKIQEQVLTVRLSEYWDTHRPRGLVYIPSASYPEMMRWAGSHTWRGFLMKYGEANLLHKTHQELHRRLSRRRRKSPAAAEAQQHLLAAECNDVYWHGWFGGLYSPHLRQVAFAHLLAADRALQKLAPVPPLRQIDLLRNGSEFIEMRSEDLRILVDAVDGGTIVELDALGANANLINSIRRRPEPYHEELRQRSALNPANLPGAAQAPEAGLAAKLIYDACAPNCARLYRATEPDSAAYRVARARNGHILLEGPHGQREIELQKSTLACEIACAATETPVSLEWIFNLLAPKAPDRGLLHQGRRLALDWEGELSPEPLTLCDGWRRLHIELQAAGAAGWAVAPRYSVSQSEQGFEALYQGSALRAHWASGTRKVRVEVKIFPCSCHF